MKRDLRRQLLVLVFLLSAAFVRLWNLYDNPRWYTDETNYIILTRNIGLTYSLTDAPHKALLFPFATDAVPHPPLYFMLNGLLMRFMDAGILSGRMISALCGLVCAYLLFRATRRLFGPFAAWVAAGLFAFHYPSVFFLRWGMPYNLSMAFSIVGFWAMAEMQRQPRRIKWPALALIAAGLSATSSFFGLPILIFVSTCLLFRMRRKPLVLASIALVGWLPLVAFLALGFETRGASFVHDFLALGARASGGGSIESSISAFFVQLGRLLIGTRLRPPDYQIWPIDPVYIAGSVGLIWIAIQAKGRRWIALYFAFAAFPILLKRGSDPEIKYDEVMFLFLLYLGAGALAAVLKHRFGHKRQIAKAVVIAFSATAIAILGGLRVWQTVTHLPSRYEFVGSVNSASDAHQLAAWINERVNEDSLIIAPERVDFLLRGRVTNLYQSVAYTTGSTQWHENIEPWRWAFPADFHQAQFIILDFTDRAIVLQPNNRNMDVLAASLFSPEWRMVAEIGEYYVYQKTRG